MKKKNEVGYDRVDFPVMPMEAGDMRLFPDEYMANAASASECTGLVQVSPADEDVMDAYEDIYSFRQPKPIIDEDKEKGM